MPLSAQARVPRLAYDPAQVTVVIPAKDEGAGIAEIVFKSLPAAGRIVVIDGNSIDNTNSEARRAGAEVIADRGRGKGAAMRQAITQIRTPITVFMDADFSHDPADIPKLVAPIVQDEFDHVTGSRLIGGSSELHGGFDECFRLMGSSFITACINWRFGSRISDSQNGFRAIKTDVLRRLDLREDITTIEQEMIMKTLRLGYRLGEVGTHEYPRRHGVSHIRLSRVWPRYGWVLLREMLTVSVIARSKSAAGRRCDEAIS